MNTISIFPENGGLGFNIRYDYKNIIIPGYQFSEFKENLVEILTEDYGCSLQQIEKIKNIIKDNKTDIIY